MDTKYKTAWAKKRAIAGRAYISSLRVKTMCATCGVQPIEWHCYAHDAKPHHRICELVNKGASIQRLAHEIAICTPLCRSCHIKLDGRMHGRVIRRRKPSPAAPDLATFAPATFVARYMAAGKR